MKPILEYKYLSDVISSYRRSADGREAVINLVAGEVVFMPTKVLLNYAKFKEALFEGAGIIVRHVGEERNTSRETQLRHEYLLGLVESEAHV